MACEVFSPSEWIPEKSLSKKVSLLQDQDVARYYLLYQWDVVFCYNITLRRILMVNFFMFKKDVSECNRIAITVTAIILLVQQLTLFLWLPCHYCDNYGCLMHHLGLLRFLCRHCRDFIDVSMSLWLSMSTLLSYNWCFLSSSLP